MRLTIASAAPLPVPRGEAQVETVLPWRPFVFAALGFTLTVGALTGAIDLWHLRVGLQPVPIDHHRAHGFAQLFGFLGLFTMGMSLHLAPRFFGGAPATQARRRLMAWAGIGGVTLLVLGRFGALLPGSGLLGLVGALLVGVAMTAWADLLVKLLRDLPRDVPPDALQRFLVAGALWWWLAAVQVLAWTLGQVAAGPLAAVPLEGAWAAALFGGTGSWLWGIFLRAGICTLHVKRPKEREQRRLFVGWQAAAALAVLAPWVEHPVFSALQQLAAALAVGLVWATLRPWTAEGLDQDQNLTRRAVQVGLGFLAVFAALALWSALGSLGVVDAPALLRDAQRHTYTLGGVTLMVLGFGGRMVPGFSGRPLRWRAGYDAGVVALALAALLRLSELVTTRLGLSLAGASGGLAFLGVALVATALVRSAWSPVTPAAR